MKNKEFKQMMEANERYNNAKEAYVNAEFDALENDILPKQEQKPIPAEKKPNFFKRNKKKLIGGTIGVGALAGAALVLFREFRKDNSEVGIYEPDEGVALENLKEVPDSVLKVFGDILPEETHESEKE